MWAAIWSRPQLRLFVFLFSLVLTGISFFTPGDVARAHHPSPNMTLRQTPPVLPTVPSSPLSPVELPERRPTAAVEFGIAAAGECPTPTIDMKLLVIAASPTDDLTTLPAIRQVLDYLGTPYTVFTATPKPAEGTNRLA